ncbi:hypothetical protein ACFWNN_28655 [Lentzea sp. NPDC058450]|uniref:hypothetical protein n=1 Tax=Lentzea sp. NPDC058450 TaxID=3346505 RepID=UPI0036637F54
MDAEITPALRQAAHLMALAQHLTRHSHLVPVDVTRGSEPAHQLRTRREFAARDLVAWSDSLSEPSVSVRAIGYEAYVEVSGETSATRVLAWTTVPGFLDYLGWKSGEETRSVAVGELRAFAVAQEVA